MTLEVIQRAVKEMNGAVTIQSISKTSVHAMMFLRALLKRMRLSGRPEATYMEVINCIVCCNMTFLVTIKDHMFDR